uniref:N-acetyltransferase domain-containing protein n=1 Tax=Panagrolaimus davidi TaxID=227884 RepID=A0A914PZE4_9BILA
MENKDEKLNFVVGDLSKYSEMVMKMIIYEYSQEAPITKAIGAKPDEIKDLCLEACKESINSPVSVLAFLGEKCVGWVLNYIKTEIQECSEDPNLSFKKDFTEKIANKGYDNSKANKIAAIGDEITRDFSYYIPNCKKLFVLHILFVHPDFGGKGIATKLTEKSIELAKENQCDYIMSVPSNIKSAHIFTKFGFELVREIPFDAFQENGQSFVKDLGDGNKSTRLMFLKIF